MQQFRSLVYIQKKMNNSQWHMYSVVHSSTVYSSQDMEATQVPRNRQLDQEDAVLNVSRNWWNAVLRVKDRKAVSILVVPPHDHLADWELPLVALARITTDHPSSFISLALGKIKIQSWKYGFYWMCNGSHTTIKSKNLKSSHRGPHCTHGYCKSQTPYQWLGGGYKWLTGERFRWL